MQLTCYPALPKHLADQCQEPLAEKNSLIKIQGCPGKPLKPITHRPLYNSYARVQFFEFQASWGRQFTNTPPKQRIHHLFKTPKTEPSVLKAAAVMLCSTLHCAAMDHYGWP